MWIRRAKNFPLHSSNRTCSPRLWILSPPKRTPPSSPSSTRVDGFLGQHSHANTVTFAKQEQANAIERSLSSNLHQQQRFCSIVACWHVHSLIPKRGHRNLLTSLMICFLL